MSGSLAPRRVGGDGAPHSGGQAVGNYFVALKGPLAGQVFPLPPVATALGADPMNHINWPDEALAAQHAVVRWDGQRHHLVDLGSASGTWVNGQRLSAPHALQPGDELALGASLFRFETTASTRRLQPEDSSAGATAPLAEQAAAAATSSQHALALPPMAALVGAALLMAAVLFLVAALRDRSAVPTPLPATQPAQQPYRSPTPVQAAVPTQTAVPESRPRYYPAPVLLSPANGAQGAVVLLQWSWPGALQVDEWYSVWVWRGDESPRSLAWTKEPQMEIGAGLASGTYGWQVVVVQGVMQGQHQRDLSAPSEVRQFSILSRTATLTPRPTSTHTPTPSVTSTATATQTPEPVVLMIITGRVYDARLGPASPLPGAEVRVYLAEHRAIVRSDAAGQYRAEFRLRGQISGQRLDLLVAMPGYDPGAEHVLLASYPPASTQTLLADVALVRSATPTATWLPPTATPSPPPTMTSMPTTLTPAP